MLEIRQEDLTRTADEFVDGKKFKDIIALMAQTEESEARLTEIVDELAAKRMPDKTHAEVLLMEIIHILDAKHVWDDDIVRLFAHAGDNWERCFRIIQGMSVPTRKAIEEKGRDCTIGDSILSMESVGQFINGEKDINWNRLKMSVRLSTAKTEEMEKERLGLSPDATSEEVNEAQMKDALGEERYQELIEKRERRREMSMEEMMVKLMAIKELAERAEEFGEKKQNGTLTLEEQKHITELVVNSASPLYASKWYENDMIPWIERITEGFDDDVQYMLYELIESGVLAFKEMGVFIAHFTINELRNEFGLPLSLDLKNAIKVAIEAKGMGDPSEGNWAQPYPALASLVVAYKFDLVTGGELRAILRGEEDYNIGRDRIAEKAGDTTSEINTQMNDHAKELNDEAWKKYGDPDV